MQILSDCLSYFYLEKHDLSEKRWSSFSRLPKKKITNTWNCWTEQTPRYETFWFILNRVWILSRWLLNQFFSWIGESPFFLWFFRRWSINSTSSKKDILKTDSPAAFSGAKKQLNTQSIGKKTSFYRDLKKSLPCCCWAFAQAWWKKPRIRLPCQGYPLSLANLPTGGNSAMCSGQLWIKLATNSGHQISSIPPTLFFDYSTLALATFTRQLILSPNGISQLSRLHHQKILPWMRCIFFIFKIDRLF